MPQPIPRHELLGLRERSIDDGALLAVEPNALALRARVEAASLEYHPGFDQLVVELLVLRHSFRRWGSRCRALVSFLSHYQYTHVCLLIFTTSAWLRARAFEASLTHRMTGGIFDM